MTTRFIHTADWQIGKPFANFPPALAGELIAARLAAIPKIAGLARAHGAAHVLVAGDVFDSEHIDTPTIRRTLEHLRQEEGITWALLPGNHDCARTGGIWERIQRIGLPSNVSALTTDALFHISAKAAVLPAPLTSKNPGRDPTAWMDAAETSPGVLRIGLAHGSVQGFGSEGECSVALARDRAARAGLAYLALGDWHGTKEIDPRTWYSGTPEPDRFKSNNAGNVLAVTLDGAAKPVVALHRTASYSWFETALAIRTGDDLASLARQVDGIENAASRALMRLTLSGSLSLADFSKAEEFLRQLEGRLRHLEWDSSTVATRADSADLESLERQGVLGDTARHLSALAGDAHNPERHIAELALRRLFAFAAEDREAGA